ncbi:PEP-CTERM sorting domain-containing protein [Zoogloea sp.]|uniref:PEP-CTERM sorting domain-containing protein n=1 Tax=Zoogloea sp. TaxID=49181 RepID=UPI0031FD5278
MKKHLIALALAVTAGAAQADVITQNDSYGYNTTNWTHTLGTLNQFDSLLGTLNFITVTLYGAINQNLSAENTGATSDNLTPVAGGTIRFRQGGSTVLAQVLPTTTGTAFAATAYDGTSDFGGTSGINFGVLSANDSTTVTLSGAALTAFIGTGTLSGFDVRAIGNGAINSDNGNLDSSISTEALARLTLTYDYTPTTNKVPEPASMALVGLGMMGMMALRRRR